MSGTTNKESKNKGNFGSLLLLINIDILQNLGFNYWDMGMDIEYKSHLGAQQFPRSQFYSILKEFRNKATPFSFEKIRYENITKCDKINLLNNSSEFFKFNQISQLCVLEFPFFQLMSLQFIKQKLLNQLKNRKNYIQRKIPKALKTKLKSKIVTQEEIKSLFKILLKEKYNNDFENLIIKKEFSEIINEVQNIHESKLFSELSRYLKKKIKNIFTSSLKLTE